MLNPKRWERDIGPDKEANVFFRRIMKGAPVMWEYCGRYRPVAGTSSVRTSDMNCTNMDIEDNPEKMSKATLDGVVKYMHGKNWLRKIHGWAVRTGKDKVFAATDKGREGLVEAAGWGDGTGAGVLDIVQRPIRV